MAAGLLASPTIKAGEPVATRTIQTGGVEVVPVRLVAVRLPSYTQPIKVRVVK